MRINMKSTFIRSLSKSHTANQSINQWASIIYRVVEEQFMIIENKRKLENHLQIFINVPKSE